MDEKKDYTNIFKMIDSGDDTMIELAFSVIEDEDSFIASYRDYCKKRIDDSEQGIKMRFGKSTIVRISNLYKTCNLQWKNHVWPALSFEECLNRVTKALHKQIQRWKKKGKMI